MTNHSDQSNRAILERLAVQAMTDRGLLADFSAQAMSEAAGVKSPGCDGSDCRDLRNLLWASIDNDDSRDLDQLSVAEALPGDKIKVLVAIADVDAVVAGLTAIEEHARHNTTSVYTAAEILPMLPERLSTDNSSLGQGADRAAIIVEMVVSADGSVSNSSIYRACVRNRRPSWPITASPPGWAVAPRPRRWRRSRGSTRTSACKTKAAPGAGEGLRQLHGALTFNTNQSRAKFDGDAVTGLELEQPDRATQLIEDFMVAANGVTARFLEAINFPCLRRVVRTPKRWDGIVESARQQGTALPAAPDAPALNAFLAKQKQADPDRFPDLSLAVIKLMGPGEYVAEVPGDTEALGHFGLAVEHYSHSTAPNRRYPDVITQRLLKAALAGRPAPYANDELADLAKHCTDQEDAAKKVERQIAKSAAAILLQSLIGQRFDAIVTGDNDKGTWVRIFNPPVEGKLVQGAQGLGVGRKLQVELLRTDVERGFIDFKKVG